VHNGSSLFTGDAGQGESNIRRWIIENDWLEAHRPVAVIVQREEQLAMRNTCVTEFTRAVVLLIASTPLFAHHGDAAFDNTKKLTIKGTVTEWVWANPHCWLKFDVKNDSGEVTHWLAEETNPPGLINSGWTKDSLKPGDIGSCLAGINGRRLSHFRKRRQASTLLRLFLSE
jgi:hypothetical protein